MSAAPYLIWTLSALALIGIVAAAFYIRTRRSRVAAQVAKELQLAFSRSWALPYAWTIEGSAGEFLIRVREVEPTSRQTRLIQTVVILPGTPAEQFKLTRQHEVYDDRVLAPTTPLGDPDLDFEFRFEGTDPIAAKNHLQGRLRDIACDPSVMRYHVQGNELWLESARDSQDPDELKTAVALALEAANLMFPAPVVGKEETG